MKNHSLTSILLAGGRSKRMGSPKGLLTIKDKTWLEHQLKSFSQTSVASLTLILGYAWQDYLNQHSFLKGSLEKPTTYLNFQLSTFVNPNPEQGHWSSLICGLTNISKFTDLNSVYIWPIDVPCPKTKTWNEINELKKSFYVVLPTFKNQGGHPVLIDYSWAKSLVSLPPEADDSRLDWQIKKIEKNGKVLRHEVEDEKVVLNLNTPEQWKNFCNQEGLTHVKN